jgi:uncharacterized protein YeaO (DUF488 family)
VVKVTRAQIHKARGVDVTAKSASREAIVFSPNWALVMGYKQGQINMAEYKIRYLSALHQIVGPHDIWWLYDQAVEGVLTLLCYCRDQDFCHTYLLMDWLVENYPELFKK